MLLRVTIDIPPENAIAEKCEQQCNYSAGIVTYMSSITLTYVYKCSYSDVNMTVLQQWLLNCL